MFIYTYISVYIYIEFIYSLINNECAMCNRKIFNLKVERKYNLQTQM